MPLTELWNDRGRVDAVCAGFLGETEIVRLLSEEDFPGLHCYVQTVEDAGPELFAFIESYFNARRLHSTNNYRSPNETEADCRSGAMAA